MNAFSFLNAMRKDIWVGALTRTSRYAIQKVVEQLPASTRTVVEYGAGDGPITARLSEELGQGDAAQIIAIERNHDLAEDLRQRALRAVRVVEDDVLTLSQNLPGLAGGDVDAVISGIPFTFFSQEQRDLIVRGTHQGLRQGGRFIVYQYSPLMRKVLKKHFANVYMKLEIRNFFPYWVMVAEKKLLQ